MVFQPAGGIAQLNAFHLQSEAPGVQEAAQIICCESASAFGSLAVSDFILPGSSCTSPEAPRSRTFIKVWSPAFRASMDFEYDALTQERQVPS